MVVYCYSNGCYRNQGKRNRWPQPQAPATTETLPAELVQPGSEIPVDVADSNEGEGEVADFSDREDEFGEGFGGADVGHHEKMDCPKASYASGDCHFAE